MRRFHIQNSGVNMEMLNSADFWIGLVKIIWINIILSGDNAVVIALAARSLPLNSKRKPSCSAPAPPWCCVSC
jgi:predicted tellurium resistance membrane protein TerC